MDRLRWGTDRRLASISLCSSGLSAADLEYRYANRLAMNSSTTSGEGKKLLYFVTEDWYFCLHWLPLAIAVRDAGFDVTVLTRVSEHGERIRGAGLGLIPIPLSRGGTNPFLELGLLRRLIAVLRREQPELIHNIAQKPVLYGTLAARLAGVPAVVNTLAGLGFMFSSQGAKARLLRIAAVHAYRHLLKEPNVRVIVQNPDDAEHLRAHASVEPVLIRGAGVDLGRFRPTPEPPEPVVVALASRLLWDKGVAEFVEAASLLRERGVAARLALVGKPDPGNPTAVAEARLSAWAQQGLVEWWGYREDMPRVLEQTHIVCLPSYREGLPTILIEGAAAGRALVATDVPGCREVVRDRMNGFLVPPYDALKLADALQQLVEDAALRKAFGEQSRTLAEAEFGIQRVVRDTLHVYRDSLGIAPPGAVEPGGAPVPPQRLSIVFIAHFAGSPAHGMVYGHYYLAREWVRKGHQVTIIASGYSHTRYKQPTLRGGLTEEWIDGIRYLWLRTSPYSAESRVGRIANIFEFLVRLGLRRLPIRRADVVIASSHYPFAIHPASRLARRFGARLVFEVRDLWPLTLIELGKISMSHPLIRLMQRSEDYAYRHAGKVVCVLPGAKDHCIQHGMRPDKFLFIPNGVDLDARPGVESLPAEHEAKLESLRAEGAFLVGYAGAVGLANALHCAVEALAGCAHTSVHFVILGQGAYEANLRRLAESIGVALRLHFLPPVRKPQVADFLKRIDVTYIGLQQRPLFRFGVSPTKLNDYMLAAKPIVYAVDAPCDIVAESGAGISCGAENPRAIADAFDKLAGTPGPELAAMGRRGRDWIIANRSYSVLAERFLQAIVSAETP